MRAASFLLATLVSAAAALASLTPVAASGQARPADAAEPGATSIVPIPPTPRAPVPRQVPSIGTVPDLEGWEGRSLARVSVVLEGNIWDDLRAPAIKSVKAGEALTPAAARRALDEVLATGQFARGRVLVTSDKSGPALVVRVVPRKRIERLVVDLHGAHLDVEEVLRAADLSEGGELVGADVEETSDRIKRFFAMHGYPSALIDVQTRATDDPTRALVLLDVRPGPPRLVDERDFYIFDADPAAVRAKADVYNIKVHDRADEPTMDAADVALEQSLHAQGWYRAIVSHDLVRVTPKGESSPGGRVVLRVRIDAGPLRVPRFEGSDHYDDGTLTAALALETETDRSPSHLAEKLRIFYQKRGFLDAQVRAEVRGSDQERVQVVVFHVDEHRRVQVVARRFPCLKLDAIRRLSGGGPRSVAEIGTEIDSFLEEDLPGADLLVDPDPRGVSATIGGGAGQLRTGARPPPLDLHPDTTYVADTYERAVEHVQELYRNEGFLHATVGPLEVVRARCDPRSPPGACVPLPLPPLPVQMCTYDATGLPLPSQPIDSAFTCVPDPAHGVECAPTLALVIPVKLGPRTSLWDIAFTGVKSVSEQELAAAAELPLGEPGNLVKVDDARRRLVDWYKERGYAYADVKYALEPSPDNTRARVRFDVTEGDQVFVRAVVIHGLDLTRESAVRRRIALEEGQPYRTSDVRRTQERIATLGVFSSVNVGLSEPYSPGPSKTVIIDVVERAPQYVEVRPGFSTGEGVRGTIEYGHRNVLGYAWGITVHLQASYLPDVLILDPAVATNYRKLSASDRIATRDTVTLAWPEVGLGPTVRAQIDGIYVRDLERDFTLLKGAALATVLWRPVREVQLSGGPSLERNDVYLFDPGQTIQCYLTNYMAQGCVAPAATGTPSAINTLAVQQLLRVPDGDSNAVSARLLFTWDRRDAPFNAHRGMYIALGGEQVNSYPVQGTADPRLQFESHFVRLTQTFAGYIPISRSVIFAAELRLGEVANVLACKSPYDTTHTPPPSYCTYPDRLFFMGGFDSMRGWLQDSFIPQEYANQIASGGIKCTSSSTSCGVPLGGGNLMINPRFELRFPVRPPLDGALFADFGNLWTDPRDVFAHGTSLRADVGAGVRVQTPVGPLVFDYGINVTRRSYEDFGAFHFAIGLF